MSANAFSATCHTHRGWLAPLLLLLATLLACERREAPIVTHQEVQKTPQLAAKPLTVDEAVATATQFASDLLGQDTRSSGITPLLSRRTRGDNGERDTMLLAVHLAGGGLTFVDPRLEAQDAVLCVLPDTDSVEDVPPPAQFFIEAICERIPAWRIDPDDDGPIAWPPTFRPRPDKDRPFVTYDTRGPWLKTKWAQSGGYNKYCVIDGVLCMAGCIPVAIGQVLAFHRVPSHIPWDGVLRATKPTGSYMDTVAYLLRQIGQKANAKYGQSATSAYSTSIVPTLKAYGLSSKNVGDNSDAAIRDLKENRPVIITGSQKGATSGHAWVLGGIQIKTTCTKQYDSKGNPISEECSKSYLVHANMGWGGSGDGWYSINYYKVSDNRWYNYNFTFITEIRP